MDTIVLAVCVDCIMAIANGEMSEDEARTNEVLAGVISWYDEGYTLVVGDDEDTFSWAPCGCCGSTLGGSRHEAAAAPR